MLFFCTVLLSCAFIAPKNATDAIANTTGAKDLGELTLNDGELDENGKTFNGETLTKLYEAILGTNYKNVGTYNKLKKDIGTATQEWAGFTHTATLPNAIDAATLRERNNNQNLTVKIAGVDFEVVYVTLDNNDNIIVDLWQATSTYTSYWATNDSGDTGYYSLWYNRDDTKHPSNIYGLSYLRANVLGQGGKWDAFNSERANTHSPQTATAGNAKGDYAELWNNMTVGNLSNFIVSPADVKYQEVESLSYQLGQTGPTNPTKMGINEWWKFTAPNDAYGIPVSENYYNFTSNGSGWNQAGTSSAKYPLDTGYGGNGSNPITNQDQWKNDKLWLPSLTETGHNGTQVLSTGKNDKLTGIWNLDNSQRDNNGGKPVSTTLTTVTPNLSWLRSGRTYDICYLTSEGTTYHQYSSAAFAVRPALHLNLTKAQASAASGTGSDAADFTAVNTPQDLTFTYTGETFTSLEKIVKWVAGGDENLDPATKTDARLKDTISGETSWYDEVHHKLYYNTASDMSVPDTDNFLHSKASGSAPCAAVTYKIDYAQGSSDANGNSTSGKAVKTLEKFEIKNAGVYTITCKFEPDSCYKWRNPKTGALDSDATKTFKITVKQKKVAYEWKSKNGELNEANTDKDKQWKTTFALDFIPADGALANTSKAPWPFITYNLIDNTEKSVLDDTNAKKFQTYEWDSDNAKHKVRVSGKDDDTLPCIVLKFVSIEQYDKEIEHIYACKDPEAKKGEKYPQHAGNYRAEAEDVNAKTSNYELVAKDDATTMKRTYEIERMEIETPAVRDPKEYTGDWVEFEIAAFNTKVGTGTSAKWYHEFVKYGNLNNDEFEEFLMPTDDNGNDLGLKHELSGTNQNKLVFKAHDADEYTIYYRLATVEVENTAKYPNPVVRNYKWKCTTPETVKDVEGRKVDGKSDDLKRVYEIAPKTLEFSFSSLKKNDSGEFVDAKTWDIKANDETSKLTYSFAVGKEPVVIRTLGADGLTWEIDPNGNKEAPVLELWYYETKKGDTAAKKPVLADGDDPEEFIFYSIKDANNEHTAGEYTIMIKLAVIDDSKPETLVNKNYRLKVTPERNDGESDEDYQKRVDDALKTYRQAMKLKPGEASLDDISIKYQSDVMKEDGDLPSDLPYADPDVEGSKNLAYGWNADKKAPLQYFFTADFDDIDFLELDTAYGNGGYVLIYLDKDGNEVATLGDGEGFAKASKVRVKFKVRVKADERTNNKMPKASEYKDVEEGGKFIYTAGEPDSDGNIFDGVLCFDYEIVKATVSEKALKDLPLQYQFTGDTKWTAYDPENPPEYNSGKSITFRPDPDKLPQGVKSAEVAQTLGDFKNPGTPTITIKVTVDDNYDDVKNYNLKPTISAQVIDIGADMWKVENLKDADGETVKDGQGAPYQITTLNPEKLADRTYAEYIDYEYWTMVDDGEGGFKPGVLIGKNQDAIDKLIDPEGDYKASSTNSYPVYVRPVLNDKAPKTATGVPKFVLKDKSGNSVVDDDGNSGFMAYNFGESKDLIVVKMLKTSSVYGDSVNCAEIFGITYEDGTAFQSEHYIIKIADPKNNDLGLLAGFDFSKADAGVYTLTIEFTDPEMAKDFVFTESGGKFTIEKKAIAVPTLSNFEYNGSIIDVISKLGGTYLDEELKKYMVLSGDTEGKDVKNGGYVIFIKLNNDNYKWADGDEAVKLVLTGATAEVTSDDTAKLVWNITPFVLKDLKWDTSDTNAKLNIPENVQAILSAAGVEIGYNYYDQNGELVTKLEGGKTYRAEAVLTGDGAALGNVVFEKTSEDGSKVPGLVSDKKVYETKKSFFASALSWAKNNWWILVAIAAAIILLIILICVLVHRRKTKEEREAKKEAKEEEKRRKEEEREEEKRRKEAERELEKAKAEAELAKMRAGLGVGAAGMAMAAQQQPVQQPQYVQQPVADTNALARIEAEIAAMRAEHRMQQPQQPQYMPQMMPMQMPQYPQNNFGPQPGYGGGGNNDGGAISRLENAFMSMRAEQRTDAKLENELLKLRLDMKDGNSPAPRQPVYEQPTAAPNANGNNAQLAEQFGMMMAAMMKSMGVTPKAKEEPKPVLAQSTDDTVITTPTVYPPDAVITTTTTVDTTKPKPEVSRDTERNFDIDGFYDSFDPNKNSL